MSEDRASQYDIGAVSRLTGLSTPNLRMWERRYGVVEPARTESKRRLYTAEDIRRLTLLKNLVDRGQAIGGIASLSTAQLEERLAEQAGARRSRPREEPRTCRLMIVGNAIREMVRSEGGIKGTRVTKEFGGIDEAMEGLEGFSADLLIVECPTLFPETVVEVQKLVEKASAVRAIVVYWFAPSETARMVDKDIEGITAIRAPVDVGELELACRAEVGLAGEQNAEEGAVETSVGEAMAGTIPARLFTDRQLAKISRISTTVECECPQHLSSLLSSLTAFEKYSGECEDRNPEDANLHARLHRTTAQARGMMEEALRELLTAEGLEVS